MFCQQVDEVDTERTTDKKAKIYPKLYKSFKIYFEKVLRPIALVLALQNVNKLLKLLNDRVRFCKVRLFFNILGVNGKHTFKTSYERAH